MQAVILSGGCGNQLRPLTETVAGPLLLVEQEPLLHCVIQRLEAAGINEIIIAGGEHADEINGLILNRGYRSWIQVLPEPTVFGDAGAVKRIERLIHGALLVDHAEALFDFDLRSLLEAHFRNSAILTVASSRTWTGGSHRSLEVDDANWIWAMNGPAERGRLAGTGPYVMEPELIETIPPGQKYDIATDLLPRLVTVGASVFAAELTGRWVALDSLEAYLECQRWFLRRDHGDGFIHPSACVSPDARLHPPFFIGPSLRVGHDAVIGPDTVLAGQSIIGAASRVTDSIIYPKARIGARCSIESSVIAPDVRLLDDVKLEPQVIIGAGARIPGNRVLRTGARITSAPSPDTLMSA